MSEQCSHPIAYSSVVHKRSCFTLNLLFALVKCMSLRLTSDSWAETLVFISCDSSSMLPLLRKNTPPVAAAGVAECVLDALVARGQRALDLQQRLESDGTPFLIHNPRRETYRVPPATEWVVQVLAAGIPSSEIEPLLVDFAQMPACSAAGELEHQLVNLMRQYQRPPGDRQADSRSGSSLRSSVSSITSRLRSSLSAIRNSVGLRSNKIAPATMSSHSMHGEPCTDDLFHEQQV